MMSLTPLTIAPRFLLLDGNVQTCICIADYVHYFKYEVDCVYSVDGAQRQMESHEYMGLILDSQTLIKRGDTLLEWLRTRSRMEPIIMINSGMDERRRQFADFIRSGQVVRILKKPIQPLMLREALACAIRQSECGAARP